LVRDDDIAAVKALAAGDLAGWHGLPAGLGDATLAAALGAGGEEVSSQLGGLPAVYRTYPAAAGVQSGVMAWFEGEDAVALEIRDPPLTAPPDEQLGAPEAEAPSGLGTSYRQQVYGTRGLALHVSGVTDEVRRLYAFAAGDADEFLASPLGRVEERRIPRR
jgi:hypothetical protein